MNTINLLKSDNNATVKGVIGQEIIISLNEQPSSGYRWSYKSLGHAILLSNHYYDYNPAIPENEEGMHHFHFEMLNTGETDIILSLKRGWEKSREGKELFCIHVLIN